MTETRPPVVRIGSTNLQKTQDFSETHKRLQEDTCSIRNTSETAVSSH